jgi:hypothetical protein
MEHYFQRPFRPVEHLALVVANNIALPDIPEKMNCWQFATDNPPRRGGRNLSCYQ